jgi:putative transposase
VGIRIGKSGGKPAVAADNTLDRRFEVDAQDAVWMTDITYIKTYEGWSDLTVATVASQVLVSCVVFLAQ